MSCFCEIKLIKILKTNALTSHSLTLSPLTSMKIVWLFYGMFQTRFFKSGAKIKKLYIQGRKNESCISECIRQVCVKKEKEAGDMPPLPFFILKKLFEIINPSCTDNLPARSYLRTSQPRPGMENLRRIVPPRRFHF
jgi:hypothetical protein